MEVTKVFTRSYSSGKLVGFADVEFNGFMTWKGIKIFQSDKGNGYDIGLPSQKDPNNKVDENGRPIYFPIIKLDLENEKAQGFLSYLQQEITKVFILNQKRQENPGSLESKPSNNNYSSPIGEDDIPF